MESFGWCCAGRLLALRLVCRGFGRGRCRARGEAAYRYRTTSQAEVCHAVMSVAAKSVSLASPHVPRGHIRTCHMGRTCGEAREIKTTTRAFLLLCRFFTGRPARNARPRPRSRPGDQTRRDSSWPRRSPAPGLKGGVGAGGRTRAHVGCGVWGVGGRCEAQRIDWVGSALRQRRRDMRGRARACAGVRWCWRRRWSWLSGAAGWRGWLHPRGLDRPAAGPAAPPCPPSHSTSASAHSVPRLRSTARLAFTAARK